MCFLRPRADAEWAFARKVPIYRRVMVQDLQLQPTDAQALAREVAVPASTPLGRLVPSAPSHPDPSIDRWVERAQRRSRKRMPAGLMLLGLLSVTAVLLVWWL